MEFRNELVASILLRVLGLFFCFSGILKILDPSEFQSQILAYQIFNYPVSAVVAHYLPAVELVLGLGLMLRFQVGSTLVLVFALLVMFTVLLAWTWMVGIDLECGCLGPIDFASSQRDAIIRNAILILIAVYCHTTFTESPKTGSE
jgi:uncharacterized membrane protein YphA (DoxX/SURF4 family)